MNLLQDLIEMMRSLNSASPHLLNPRQLTIIITECWSRDGSLTAFRIQVLWRVRCMYISSADKEAIYYEKNLNSPYMKVVQGLT